MHTLEQLRSGSLSGITRLNLSANLSEFPKEIYSLADSLEILDLSNNQLDTLPDDLDRLYKLKVVFCSNNKFEVLPAVLGKCERMEMIGFKSNQIHTVPAVALPPKLRWLILTDNQLEALPKQIGLASGLQKLMLAGNRLTELPDTLKDCQRLQLLRIAANQLAAFPEVVLQLPELAWLAYSGNPFCKENTTVVEAKKYSRGDIVLGEVLGQGASGVISRASWSNNTCATDDEAFAVKVFKGAVTSDGYPEDELNICLRMGEHPNLVSTFGFIQEASHSSALMHLIPSNYVNLGLPPSLESCTRDVFTDQMQLTFKDVQHLATQLESAINFLHSHHIAHGDIYAHNVSLSPEKHILFGDFGASSDFSYLPVQTQTLIKRIEQRALGFFIDDLLMHVEKHKLSNEHDSEDDLALSRELKFKAEDLINGNV